MDLRSKIILIYGPTASGKSLFAIKLAKKIKGEIINVTIGPVVTRYELEPAPGTRSSRVVSLSDDIARSMSAKSARVAVIFGKNAIGIELPNKNIEKVFFHAQSIYPSYHFIV